MAQNLRPYASYVPNAITDLYNFLVAATEGEADFMVKDGPWVSDEADNAVICIGWAGFPTGVTRPAMQLQEQLGNPDITSEAEIMGLGGGIMETFQIVCGSFARDGNNSVPSARARAYANVAVVGQILSQHQIQGSAVQQIGGVMQVLMGKTHTLHQVQDRRGAVALVTFNIEAKAFAQQ